MNFIYSSNLAKNKVQYNKQNKEGAVELLYVLGIVACVMCVPITAIITEQKRKSLKIKAEMIRDEIELEKLKQQNFIAETEKMKLELKKMSLNFPPDKFDNMKIL